MSYLIPLDLNETLGGNLTFYIMKTRESGDDAERLAAEINEQLVYVCVKYDCDEIYYSESADCWIDHNLSTDFPYRLKALSSLVPLRSQ